MKRLHRTVGAVHETHFDTSSNLLFAGVDLSHHPDEPGCSGGTASRGASLSDCRCLLFVGGSVSLQLSHGQSLSCPNPARFVLFGRFLLVLVTVFAVIISVCDLDVNGGRWIVLRSCRLKPPLFFRGFLFSSWRAHISIHC